jgi:nucleotide-binding universal stress UspA family protein
MKANKILVPIDFSTCSTAALELATNLARDSGATLLLVHVDETPLLFAGEDMYFGPGPMDFKDEVRMQLSDLALPDETVACERFLETGDPCEEIVRVAEEQDVNFIVIGTHGRRGLPRLLLGSVAEGVMRRATCPVITVRESAATRKANYQELAATA